MPYRDSPHHENEKVMSLKTLNISKSNEDKNFLFEIEDKKRIYVGENLVSIVTGDRIVENLSKKGLLMLNTHKLTVKRAFTLCFIENISPLKNMKIQQR